MSIETPPATAPASPPTIPPTNPAVSAPSTIVVEIHGPNENGSSAIEILVHAPSLDEDALRRELASRLVAMLRQLHDHTVDSVMYRYGRITLRMSHPDHPGHRTVESVQDLVPIIIGYIKAATGYQVHVLRTGQQLVLVDCRAYDDETHPGLIFELPTSIKLIGDSRANRLMQSAVKSALAGYPGFVKAVVSTEGNRRRLVVSFLADAFNSGACNTSRVMQAVLGLIALRRSLDGATELVVRTSTVDIEPVSASIPLEDGEDSGFDPTPEEY